MGTPQAPQARDSDGQGRSVLTDPPRGRRGNTRQRIQEIALELFAERGYDKTSLREIAEHLRVTKAALYYHFKTKEDILLSLFRDLMHPLDELIAWGQEQPRTLETKRELLRRYSEALQTAAPLFLFMQQNEAAMRELSIGQIFRERLTALFELLKDEDASLTDQVRCASAMFTMHSTMFGLQAIEGDLTDKRRAALEVAIELVSRTQADNPSATGTNEPPDPA
jgi:AcrR family transcriptional regulator